MLDLFAIPNLNIRKGRPHGHRYGKKEGCKEFHTAKQLQKRCLKKQYENIHDRFIRDKWWLKSSLSLSPSSPAIHDERFSLILFDLSLSFHLHFPVFSCSPSSCTPISTTRTPCKMTCATSPRGASSPLTDTHSLTSHEPNDTDGAQRHVCRVR